jgi:ATP-binding protein involved in chromosome partitioning
MNPVKLKIVDKKKLLINWNDGSEDLLQLRDLRKFCPCATCLAERERQSKMFIPLFSENQITAKSIKQVGNYAIQIEWNDGHNTGLYEYKFLKNFAETVKV